MHLKVINFVGELIVGEWCEGVFSRESHYPAKD